MGQVRKKTKDRVRAVLHFQGDVQNIGFRGLALRTGRRLGLTGIIENLPDGRVRVTCEGPKGAILEFAEQLKKADDIITVTRVNKRFGKATGEFVSFMVRYEDMGQEMFQGFETAAMYLVKVREEVKDVGRKVDGVGNKVDSMHEDMNKRFLEMNEKYHVISKVLISHTDALTKLVETLVEKKNKEDK